MNIQSKSPYQMPTNFVSIGMKYTSLSSITYASRKHQREYNLLEIEIRKRKSNFDNWVIVGSSLTFHLILVYVVRLLGVLCMTPLHVFNTFSQLYGGIEMVLTNVSSHFSIGLMFY